MDLEARSLQPGIKATLLAKLREYKSDLNKLKREFKRISSSNANQAAHDELLESGMADAHAVISGSYIISLVFFRFHAITFFQFLIGKVCLI